LSSARSRLWMCASTAASRRCFSSSAPRQAGSRHGGRSRSIRRLRYERSDSARRTAMDRLARALSWAVFMTGANDPVRSLHVHLHDASTPEAVLARVSALGRGRFRVRQRRPARLAPDVAGRNRPRARVDRSSLTLDPQGRPVVGYSNAPLTSGANQAWVKRWNGSGWEALGGQLNTSGTEAGSPQLAIDAGDVVAVWAEAPPSSSLQETIRAARWTGSSWAPIGAQVTPAGTYGNGLRVAAGAQGPVVTYTQWGTSASGTVTRWDGVSWKTYVSTPSM